MKVHKLNFDVTSKLQSGLCIVDATQCALELVENSLDAKATAVAVRVNLKNFTIQVVDNGTGIALDDLNLIGERFMTSKCHNVDDLSKNLLTYGYRGQAIASLLDVCTKLSIKTRSKTSKNPLIKLFKNGKAIKMFVCKKEKSGTGTTVTVYDFMSTMPVRRKRISEVFDIQDIRTQLEYLAIVHNEVCFTLQDENKGKILLQTHKRANLRLSFIDIFGIALDECITPISFTENNIEISGFISRKRHSENNFQLFYVNRRIVLKTIVHKFLNNLIDKYFYKQHKLSNESLGLGGFNFIVPKGQFNMYVVQIQCPYGWFEIFTNLRKTTIEFKNWELILNYLKKAVKLAFNITKHSIDNDCAVYPRNKIVVNKIEPKELKNGVHGASVKRKYEMVDTDCTPQMKSMKISEVEPEVTRPVFPVPAEHIPESPISDQHSLEKLKETNFSLANKLKMRHKTDFWKKFISWFKSELKNNVSAYEMFNKYTHHNLSLSDGMSVSFKPRNNNGRRRRLTHNCGDHSSDTYVNTKSLMKESSNGQQKTHKRKNDHKIKEKCMEVGREEMNKNCKMKKLQNRGKLFVTGNNFADIIGPKITQIGAPSNYSEEKECSSSSEESQKWSSHYNYNLAQQDDYIEIKRNEGRNEDFELSIDISRKNNVIDLPRLVDSICVPGFRKSTEVQTSFYKDNCDKGIQTSSPVEFANVDVNGGSQSLRSTTLFDGFKFTLDGLITSTAPSRSKADNDYDDIIFDKPLKDDSTKDVLSVGLTDVLKGKDAENTVQTPVEDDLPDTLCVPDNEASGDGATFAFSERYNFIPKGLSQIGLDKTPQNPSRQNNGLKCVLDSSSDFNVNKSCEMSPKTLIPQTIIEELKQKARENMIYYESDLFASTLSKLASKIDNFLNSFDLSKEALLNAKIIGQWDKKFILATLKFSSPEKVRLLTVFDQHAVDERIQLERIMKESRTADGAFIHCSCNPPIRCVIGESSVRFIPSLEGKLLQYGLQASVLDDQSVLLHKIPICLVGENFKDEKAEPMLRSLINDIVNEYSESRGTISGIPQILYTAMSTKACRTAVKFNDALSEDEMKKLINTLADCQTPFQCAHGRPCIAPILDLDAFITQFQANKCDSVLHLQKFSNAHKLPGKKLLDEQKPHSFSTGCKSSTLPQ